ncbi:hypothetical protein ANCCAN_03411 [Ancylostoma caninum]|uniref:mRNA cap 0 methyltransferase domain-containing protein n=1 Tax=Ancylostoma caninum TaxID=29170 RepID=A0A368H5L9_ANCCA|nr:hypothetical protein ANCCAN_03411 [Ancylostoma caninum]
MVLWCFSLLEELDMELGLEPYPPRNGAKLSAEDSEYERAKEFVKTLDSSENPNIGTLSKSEWEAFCMYLVFAFRKKGGSKAAEPSGAKSKLDDDLPVEAKRRRTEEDGETATS